MKKKIIPIWLLAIFFACLSSSTAFAYSCSERIGLFDFARQGEEIHASGLGPNFSNTWPLINKTGCAINNFTLGNPVVYLWTGAGYTRYSGAVSGSYSTFSLEPNGGIGTVTANFTFTLPPDGIYRIYFDIITDDGKMFRTCQ